MVRDLSSAVHEGTNHGNAQENPREQQKRCHHCRIHLDPLQPMRRSSRIALASPDQQTPRTGKGQGNHRASGGATLEERKAPRVTPRHFGGKRCEAASGRTRVQGSHVHLAGARWIWNDPAPAKNRSRPVGSEW